MRLQLGKVFVGKGGVAEKVVRKGFQSFLQLSHIREDTLGIRWRWRPRWM